jgi:D-alanyl-D-alanine carboxypeptidase
MRPENSGNFTTPLRYAWRLAATGAFVACAARAAPGSPPAVASAPSPGGGAPAPAAGAVDAAPMDASAASSDSAAVLTALPDALVAAADAAPLSPLPAVPESACNEQPPQPFLIRGNFLKEPHGNERAIQYRTDQYGYFKGFGHPGVSNEPPSTYAVETTFMGIGVKMHRRVVPALKCVEEDIQRSCSAHPYTAHALAGIRYRNTYRGGEVTNHAYGIAIDVDPSINTCCGCVPPWNDALACKRPARTEYDRMAMPECWVHSFERYGFYWLGHDVLRDTMHFEFLGDPDRIVRGAPTGPN